jgi:hypothetical protein
MKILGYVMAKNEWPLLGLSITHAISSGVDHVVVVNHESSDETAHGLVALEMYWPGKVTTISADGPFLQEATTALISSVVEAQFFDWIYVFDADEFILPGEGLTLAASLRSIDEECDAVRFEVHQWVSPWDFDDLDLQGYSRIRQRSVPDGSSDQSGSRLGREIESGRLNFFDVPFPSKVIVRGRNAHLLSAGAHSLRTGSPVHEKSVDPNILRVGHLPLLSRRRLGGRCEQGKALREAGFSEDHGWQSQMLSRLLESGELDAFWLRHSDHQSGVGTGLRSQCPKTVTDDALSSILTDASAKLREVLDSCASYPEEAQERFRAPDFDLQWKMATEAVRKQQVERDKLLWQLHIIELELGATIRERDKANRDLLELRSEHKEAIHEISRLIDEISKVSALEAQLLLLEDYVQLERSKVFDLTKQLESEMTRAYRAQQRVLELRQVRAEIMEIRASTSWRLGSAITSPVRKIRSLLKR